MRRIRDVDNFPKGQITRDVIARFSAIVSLFLLEYVLVSGISFVDDQTSSRLIGVGSL
jgi:hypothetical protein